MVSNGMPLIGVTASLDEISIRVSRENSDAIFRAGGMPVIVPYTSDRNQIAAVADRLDGLLLTGGGDIDPILFGEEPLPGLGSITPERDLLETELVRLMLAADKPVLAICRGCQILNVAAGGDMYQDLYSQRSELLQHAQRAPRAHASHAVDVRKHSLLHRITDMTSLRVNSFHHQAVKEMAPDFSISAEAKDGVIEAFESKVHRFVMGVQWHPEVMAPADEISERIFHAFVGACK